MTTGIGDRAAKTVRQNLDGTRDALTVRRVFGEAYELDGVKVIPVARLGGGGGGGGGDDESGSSGFGTGFGVGAYPVGVYRVHDGNVEWKPAVDVNRIARGGQVLAAIIAVCATLIMLSRRR